mgnify:CR=1 FL=1
MRLFIAVHLSDEEYFRSLQEQITLPKMWLSLTKTFHLTIKFLGEVKEVRPVLERLEKVRFLATEIIVDHIGVFPSSGDPRVLWAGIKENLVVIKLQKDIDFALEGLFASEKDWAAHVTLARVKDAKDGTDYRKKIDLAKVTPKTFKVHSFSLVESKLSRTGTEYEDIAIFPSKS